MSDTKMDSNWGHCKNCKHFASPARVPLEDEESRCTHPELSKYTLTVFGACGCNGFDLRIGLPPSIEEQAVVSSVSLEEPAADVTVQ